MKIVLQHTNSKQRKKADKRLNRFKKLKNRLEQKQKQAERFETDIDALMEIYHTRVMPVEAEEVEPLSRLVEKLSIFFGRKSLSETNREEVVDWVMEAVNTIRAFDTAKADHLKEHFFNSVADHLGMTPEEMDRQAAEELKRMEQALNDLPEPPDHSTTKRPFNKKDSPQADMFGFDDIAAEIDAEINAEFNDDSDWDSDGDSDWSQEDDITDQTRSNTEQLLNGDWLKGLFRRTARALHPDKENDPAKQEEKHRLMTRLLQARKQEDVVTIMELYSEHVSSEALSIDNDSMDAICEVLEERIEDLDERQLGYLMALPHRRMMHDLLYGKSKQIRERKIKEIIKQIRKENRETDEVVKELRNLTVLRQHLKYRRHSHNPFDDIEILFSGFPPPDSPFNPPF